MAANPLKGEIAFEVPDEDGQPETFILVFSVNALCFLEEQTGSSVNDVAGQLQSQMSLGLLRTLFWAGLSEHHPKIDKRGAGAIIQAIGAAAAGELIGRAFLAAFPSETKGRAGAAKARPRKPRAAGTG